MIPTKALSNFNVTKILVYVSGCCSFTRAARILFYMSSYTRRVRLIFLEGNSNSCSIVELPQALKKYQ